MAISRSYSSKIQIVFLERSKKKKETLSGIKIENES